MYCAFKCYSKDKFEILLLLWLWLMGQHMLQCDKENFYPIQFNSFIGTEAHCNIRMCC